MNFRKQIKPKNPEKISKKDALEYWYNIFKGRKKVLNAFDIEIFPKKVQKTGFSEKVSDHCNLKIISPKQMFQRLPIALAQVKEGNIY